MKFALPHAAEDATRSARLPGPSAAFGAPSTARAEPTPLRPRRKPRRRGQRKVKTRPATDVQAAFRLLPSIDEVLRDPRAAPLEARCGRELLQRFAAETLDAWRAEIKAGRLDGDRIVTLRAAGEPYQELERRARREEGRGVVRCVNATGVVLNTGLGRAPVHPEVADAMAVAARSYDVLEVDRATNERNQRDD